MDKFADECGIVAVLQRGNREVANTAFFGLNGIQHRGQESAGIAVNNDESISCYKEMGLVTEVFDDKILSLLKGDMCLGHVKYSNAKENFAVNAQPMVVNYKNGSLAVAINGALINATELRDEMEENGVIFSTKTDCELIAALIARYDKGDMGVAIKKTMAKIRGGFAIGIMTKDSIIGVRDKFGIRPLAFGKLEDGYVLASEDCAFDMMDGELIRDVNPGEIVIMNDQGVTSIDAFEEETTPRKKAHCIFEYVYFARPDSTIDGKNIYECRENAGRILAEECPVEADIVIGVPDSGTPAAIGYALKSDVPFAFGLIKNKYVGRTFIQPTASQRERSVKIKLNPIKSIVNGKRVVLVDDSIVRGTTMKKIIESFRHAGAKEVHLRICSPPVFHSCYFGVDTPDKNELIANTHSNEQLCELLHADSLEFISLDGLLRSVSEDKDSFCIGCYNGNYPEV